MAYWLVQVDLNESIIFCDILLREEIGYLLNGWFILGHLTHGIFGSLPKQKQSRVCIIIRLLF